jgi:hypothetical protein
MDEGYQEPYGRVNGADLSIEVRLSARANSTRRADGIGQGALLRFRWHWEALSPASSNLRSLELPVASYVL